jgi:hypothetical protein
MVARTVVYVSVLRQIPDWPLMGFAVVTLIEIPFLAAVLDRLGFALPKR